MGSATLRTEQYARDGDAVHTKLMEQVFGGTGWLVPARLTLRDRYMMLRKGVAGGVRAFAASYCSETLAGIGPRR
jgi:hypothetical protein